MPAKKAGPAPIDAPIFTDEAKARAHLESLRWPEGPVCPHCGVIGNATRLTGKAHRKGVYQCNDCREQFSVTVGTLFERSHLPLNKWLLAFHLMASSKKGMSAHQLHRMLGITYKTAWFMAHRIREAMKNTSRELLGGPGKVLEADETYWGPRPGTPRRRKNRMRPRGWYTKNTIVSLVERGGNVRSFHAPNSDANAVRRVLDTFADKRSHLMTDEAHHYRAVGKEFAEHSSIAHRHREYARGPVTTNTIEGYFSVLKRGLIGTYQHVSAQHLHRYVAEFDFRYNHRTPRMTDVERAEAMLRRVDGKRLTYRRIKG